MGTFNDPCSTSEMGSGPTITTTQADAASQVSLRTPAVFVMADGLSRTDDKPGTMGVAQFETKPDV